jgi:hypothetical protein
MATTFEQTIPATVTLVEWNFSALKRMKVMEDWVISLCYQLRKT